LFDKPKPTAGCSANGRRRRRKTYNQQDAPVSQIIYSCKTLCMFRTVFPSIIRSSKLHIQQQAYVKQLLLPAASGDEMERSISFTISAGSSIGLTIPDAVCAPDDGRRNRLKHVEQFIEINRSRKRCILLDVL